MLGLQICISNLYHLKLTLLADLVNTADTPTTIKADMTILHYPFLAIVWNYRLMLYSGNWICVPESYL
jgi:hypothetical protein